MLGSGGYVCLRACVLVACVRACLRGLLSTATPAARRAGCKTNKSSDPFYWMRVLLASARASLDPTSAPPTAPPRPAFAHGPVGLASTVRNVD